MRTKVSPSTAFRKCPICAALLGLIFVCSTIVLPDVEGTPAGGRNSADARAPRSSRILMYPLPATSIDATPGISPTASTRSAAIFFGGCLRERASWNATGTASSPNDACLGCSSAISVSMPNRMLRLARNAACICFSSCRNTEI